MTDAGLRWTEGNNPGSQLQFTLQARAAHSDVKTLTRRFKPTVYWDVNKEEVNEKKNKDVVFREALAKTVPEGGALLVLVSPLAGYLYSPAQIAGADGIFGQRGWRPQSLRVSEAGH